MTKRDNPVTGGRGFTLVELMVATAILVIFGLMVTGTLRYATGVWRSAHARSYAYDVAATVFQQFEKDLTATTTQFWGPEADSFNTDLRFWVDEDGNGRQRVRFVRVMPDGTVNPRIRVAGDGGSNDGDAATDEEYFNLRDDDDDDEIDEDLMPLGAVCEVAYMRGDPAGDYGNTLFRAVLAPIADTNSLFDDANIDTQDEIYNTTGAAAAPVPPDGVAIPLSGNVLHFEVLCWTQYTTTWDSTVSFARWAQPHVPEDSGPAMTWDSDRRTGGTDPGPAFVMDWGTVDFPDEDSDGDGTDNSGDEDYSLDNVFPRSVMAIVTVEPPEDLRERSPLRLASDFDTGDMTLTVTGNLPAYNRAWPFLRIDDEWVEFSDFDESTQAFTIAARGVRGTTEADHTAGTDALFGHTFSRAFHNPSYKEYWEH
jgi:prepilin-type N-terminal cleavage/methylation domain-containing protein